MKYLSTLRPAETLLLLKGKRTDIKELLNFTFIDLLMKEVLEIVTISKPVGPQDEMRDHKYVVRGKKFSDYTARGHEIVYLSPYRLTSSLEIPVKTLFEIGFQNSRGQKEYISALIGSNTLYPYFITTFFHVIFGGFLITSSGIKLRNEIKEELAQLERELPLTITADDVESLQLSSSIGGNVFLLKTMDFSLFKQMDPELLAAMHKKASDEGSGCGGGCGGGCSSGCGSGCGGCGGGCGGCGG
jgi:hypothetical protein